jgi:hypothetical protein
MKARVVLEVCGQALRALFRHKTRALLDAIGIAIGIAATVWVVAIGRAGTSRAKECPFARLTMSV